MSQPSPTEQTALTDSGPLLRFASEKVDNLDPALSLAIATARDAAANNAWTPQISQQFWGAFSKLCDLVQPATMDSLVASDRNLESCKWNRWRSLSKISLAERSSQRYLGLLFILLAITVPLQLYVWMCTNITKEIGDIYAANQAIINKNLDTFRKTAASTSDANHTYTQAELNAIDQLTADQSAIDANLVRALYETRLLQLVSTLHTEINLTSASQTKSDNWFTNYNATLDRQNSQQATSLRIQETANLIIGIFLSFIMPILFGTIGAVAFAIRAISDQIKSSTFSQNAPTRHLLRVGLGALAGVVVGLFNGLSTQLSLPPLAIAFLAGYGVEALFSMFDGFVEKFRR